jgi:hypothetical protein
VESGESRETFRSCNQVDIIRVDGNSIGFFRRVIIVVRFDVIEICLRFIFIELLVINILIEY